MSATEKEDAVWIPGRVRIKITEIGIHSFPA